MEILLAVVGVIFSLVGIGVMVLQVRIAAMQKNLFILDKRYDFYDALVTFLTVVIETKKSVDIVYYLPYLSARRKAEFLFDANIAKFIEDIDGYYGRFQISLADNSPQMRELREEMMSELQNAYSDGLDIFKRYMTLPR